jgi:two-component system cell cycle response regulator DivK
MSKKVLVVDDNPVSRELIREVLEDPDLQVSEAADGREAIEKISEEMPDLVLLDIRMPVSSGYDVLRWVKNDSRFRHIYVLAFTAFAMRDDRQKAIAAGFDGYVTKPINAADLRKQIASLLLNEP